MELDRYGLIIRRRMRLIVAIVVLTAVVSGIYALLVPGSYKASTELLINPVSPQSATASTYYYPPYYQELAAQFILDDFTGVIEGTTFSQQIIDLLKQSPQADVKAAADKMTTVDDAVKLSKQLTINRINRLLQVQVTASTRNDALAIAAATDQLIRQQGPTIFAELTQATQAPTDQTKALQGLSTVTVGVSDAPHITLKPSRLHEALFWLLRTAVGLVAALAIVLVLHYFDDRLYDEYDVREMLGIPVLGTVVAPAARPSALAGQRPAPVRESVTVH